MITHAIDWYWMPSQKDKSKVINLKNMTKRQNFKFLNFENKQKNITRDTAGVA